MSQRVDLFDSTYTHFETEVLARVRRKTFGEDFGQNSWTTAEEYRNWAGLLGIHSGSTVLEVASGSGGPALFLARYSGCRVRGVDINARGVATGNERVRAAGLGEQVAFEVANADEPLPFPEGLFDALLCIDSANHFPHRLQVLKDWQRVLRPGGKVLFTDPVVITGLVSNEELALRSSIGFFVFAPPGINEQLLEEAGFHLTRRDDVTGHVALVSGRWHNARAEDREALVRIEGVERYEGLQRFFATVHRLTSERRLSRFAYLAQKEAAA